MVKRRLDTVRPSTTDGNCGLGIRRQSGEPFLNASLAEQGRKKPRPGGRGLVFLAASPFACHLSRLSAAVGRLYSEPTSLPYAPVSSSRLSFAPAFWPVSFWQLYVSASFSRACSRRVCAGVWASLHHRRIVAQAGRERQARAAAH